MPVSHFGLPCSQTRDTIKNSIQARFKLDATSFVAVSNLRRNVSETVNPRHRLVSECDSSFIIWSREIWSDQNLCLPHFLQISPPYITRLFITQVSVAVAHTKANGDTRVPEVLRRVYRFSPTTAFELCTGIRSPATLKLACNGMLR
jgi:hypothetical protein